MIKIFEKYYFLIPAILFLILYFPSIFFREAWSDDTLVIVATAKNLDLVLRSFYDINQIAGGVHYMPLLYFQCYLINLIFGDNAFPFSFHLFQYLSQAIFRAKESPAFIKPIYILFDPYNENKMKLVKKNRI